MEDLYFPDDEVPTATWFNEIGEATGNEQPWNTFRKCLLQYTAASNIGLLRKARDADIDDALNSSKLGVGYKDALCEYLVRKGSPAFTFKSPMTGAVHKSKIERQTASAISTKKFASQQDRPPLGRELGPAKLAKLTFPPNIFQHIVCSKATEMCPRGKNSTQVVADAVWQWVFSEYGSVHVDLAFCEKIEELLNELWPKLKPWNGRPRTWASIIANRFTNVRSVLSNAGVQNEYKTMFQIPEVDISSPAKKLLKDGVKGVDVKSDKRSMFEVSPGAEAVRARANAEQTDDVAIAVGTAVPMLGAFPGNNPTPTAVGAAQAEAPPVADSRAAARDAEAMAASPAEATGASAASVWNDSSDEEGAHDTPKKSAATAQPAQPTRVSAAHGNKAKGKRRQREEPVVNEVSKKKKKPAKTASTASTGLLTREIAPASDLPKEPADAPNEPAPASDEPAPAPTKGARPEIVVLCFSTSELSATYAPVSDGELMDLSKSEINAWPEAVKVAKAFAMQAA